MYRRGPFGGGGYMRRRGFPLFPMGGYGMGMGGGGLIGDLMAGGIGYLMGKQSAQQAPQYQPPQYQTPQYQPSQAPQYQQPQYQPPQTPQYQPPQYQPPQTPQYQASTGTPNQQVTEASGVNERLAQLKLLGRLRDSGILTNDEFEAEKQKIMHG
jgi:Short C-terminal domain